MSSMNLLQCITVYDKCLQYYNWIIFVVLNFLTDRSTGLPESNFPNAFSITLSK